MAEHFDRTTLREPNRENNPQQAFASVSNRHTDARPFDDVIASLANATENRRARQVSEWERMRKQIFPSAS